MRNMKNLPDKESRLEIRLAGSGGQGVILAGIMLAEAATLEGNYAAQSQTYGPEARGGSSRSEVVLSTVEIDYPWSLGTDILLALTQEGYDQNAADMKEEGLVIVDSDLVHRVLWDRSISIPFRQIAIDAGEQRAINMAAMGAVAAFCPYVSRDSLAKIMANRLPPAKVDQSLQAFDRAMELARSAEPCIVNSKEEVEI
jgi:2-oxoglutarate ferredoxin oxidoreductase subunit gamma